MCVDSVKFEIIIEFMRLVYFFQPYSIVSQREKSTDKINKTKEEAFEMM